MSSGPRTPAPAGTVLRLRLIGQMEAWTVAGDNVLPPGRKTRALLAIVALAAPRAIARSKLAELLWSQRPEDLARASLRQEIHRLLEHLNTLPSEVLSVTRDAISLRPNVVWVDVHELGRATAADPAALTLLDGNLLEDMTDIDPGFEGWLAAERERLQDRVRQVAEAMLAQSTTSADTIGAARRLLSVDRTHEGAWRALMRTHLTLGERGLAIQAAERCVIALKDALDAAPSPETARAITEVRTDAPPADILATEGDYIADEPRVSRGSRRGVVRIGVLPLSSVAAPEHTHLGVSLADEITGALARLRWMFVLSSHSVARAQESMTEQAAVGRRFGLTYLLDGSIQVMGPMLRVTLRLIDCRAGAQVVWTQRFDRPADDLPRLQDEIASAVVAQVDPEILLIESARAVSSPLPINPNAYDLLLRAMPLIARTEREQFEQAGVLLRQAVEAEPDYATAHAWYAYWNVFLTAQNLVADVRPVLATARQHAERAIALDPYDARALSVLGHVRARLDRRLRDAIALHDRALTLNPNLAWGWSMSALAHAYLGDAAEAERRVQRYKHLSPMDPHAFFFDTTFILVGVQRKDYGLAIQAARGVSATHPNFPAMLRPYVAALGHAGEKAEAEAACERLLQCDPHFKVAHFVTTSPFAQPEDTQHFAEGMRRAGLE